MKEKKVKSLKIVFEDGNDYSLACEVGLDKDEVVQYIERALRPEPAEPLIKNEKVRKAVRAWYDAIDYRVDKLLCIKASGSTKLEISDGSPLIYISLFVDKGTLGNIKDRTSYTIAELCGEEEE